MLKVILTGAIAIGLAGCMTTEQMMARDDATCRSWGAFPGTGPYMECRALLHHQHAEAEMQSRANAAILSGVLLSR